MMSGKKRTGKFCVMCNTLFFRKRVDARYCSAKCRQRISRAMREGGFDTRTGTWKKP